MPNWCYNDLEVSANHKNEDSQRELEEFKRCSIETRVTDDGNTEEHLTFQGVCPMPKTLNITSGTSVTRAMTYLKALDGDYTEIDKDVQGNPLRWLFKDDIISTTDALEIKRKKYMKYLEDDLDLNDVEEGRMALNNIKEHGVKDWYDWSIDNWGTKWNASESNIHDDCDEQLSVSFETAWSPPMPWLQAATTRFPSLLFKMRVNEESEAFMGMPTAHNGIVCDNFTDIDYPPTEE